MAPPATAAVPPRSVELEDGGDVHREPLSGMVISVILAMISLVIISSFLTQRSLAVKIWGRLPFVQWLVFAIYADSFLFVFATAILQFGLGVDHSLSVCESAILLCLVCYVTTKILIYMFLVEKAHIIRSTSKKPRMRSKLYLFNSFGMIGVYSGVVVLNFVYRITKVENGECIIGMQKIAMIPLIAFDLLVNIYLTILFLIPLSSLHSFKNMPKTTGNRRLKTVAMRTFIGCVCTLTSSIVNLSVLMALDGEPGWVCLMCCNSDILFSAVVIQWVTSRDSTSSTDSMSISDPRSRGGEELGQVRSRAVRHRSSNSIGGPIDSKSPGDRTSIRPRSIDSNCSPKIVSSTVAIIDRDITEISLHDRPYHDFEHSPCSTNGPFSEDKRLVAATTTSSSRLANEKTDGDIHDDHDDDDEYEGGVRPPRPPPPARGLSHHSHHALHHVPSPPEVHVHVDYGSSLSRGTEGEGVRLGNSIVIGTAANAAATAAAEDGSRRGRQSPWRYGDAGSGAVGSAL